jgi:restriction system protein
MTTHFAAKLRMGLDWPIVPPTAMKSSICAASHPPEASFSSQPTIESVTWDQFELVVAEIYRRQGFTAEVSAGLGPDGGVDVKLTKDGSTTLVQCKQWKTRKIKVPAIRDFYGTMTHERAQRGIFITTGEYTQDCHDFAEGTPIRLLSRSAIDQLVRTAERPGENIWNISSWIDQFVAGAQILEPGCPYCRGPMVLRHPRNNSPFWGCSTFPRCHGKRQARLDLLTAKSY